MNKVELVSHLSQKQCSREGHIENVSSQTCTNFILFTKHTLFHGSYASESMYSILLQVNIY